MDPLSLAASLVAIIHAGRIGLRGLRRICESRKAPEELHQFRAELEGLQQLLENVRAFSLQKPPDQFGVLLDEPLKRAQRSIDSVNHILNSTTFGVSRFNTAAQAQVTWLRYRNRLLALSQDIRNAKMDIGLCLGSFTAFSTGRLEDESLKTFMSLRDHVTDHVSREMASVLDKLAVSDREAARRADALTQIVQPRHPSVSRGGQSKPGVSVTTRTSKRPDAPVDGLREVSQDTPLDTSGNSVLAKRKQCPSWCSCTCHSRRNLRSPGMLTALLGELNIYYSGRKEHLCSCSNSPLFNATYRFPQFLLGRYISVIYQSSKTTGPELLLRVPVVMPWDHKLWRYLVDGDIEAVQKMYEQGLASSLDISPHGANSLIYAADCGSAELVNFLIDQGVDCNFASERRDIPSELLWDRAYGGQFGVDGSIIVRKSMGKNDNLDGMGFSTLHKIILGVLYKDLRMVLEAATDLVNTTDSRGRTPLHWAVLCDNAVAVETLLAFDADPNIIDREDYLAIDFVRSSLICKSLLDAKSQIRCNPGKKGRCALHYAVITGTPVEVIDLLIDAGADVNVTDTDRETPLMNAIFHGRIEMAERLIECGTDVNTSNISSHENAIHFASSFDRPNLLPLILAKGGDYKSVNIHGRDLGHCAARFAGLEFIQIMSRSSLPGLDLDKRDRDGKTAKDYMNERIILTDSEIGIHEAFEELAAYLAPSCQLNVKVPEYSNENDIESQVPLPFDLEVPGAFPKSD